MPFGGYKDFKECVSKNSDKSNPQAYCGEIKKRTEDLNDQNLMEVVNMTTKKDQEMDEKELANTNQAEPLEFLENNLGKADFVITKEGDLFKTDFDELQQQQGILSVDSDSEMKASQSPNLKNKIRNMLKKLKRTSKETVDDLTEKQYEENYWRENKHYKEDGSAAMMETRISKCQEATGKSREVCAKEVKNRMKKAGSENTNTEDMEKTEETVDICPKELDMLREKAAKLDLLEQESEEKDKKLNDLKQVVDLMSDDYERWKETEAKKLERKVEKRIKKFSEDFLLSEEKIKEKMGEKKGKEALDYIADMKDLVESAGIKSQAKEDDPENYELDVKDFMTDFEQRKEEALAKLRHT